MNKRNLWQFIKFCFVGASNTLISQMVYFICVYVGCHYVIASLMGFVISVLNAFYWSNKYVFKTQENEHRVWWKVLIKTYIAYTGGFFLSTFLLFVWVDIIKISRFMGGIVAICHNYGLNKMDEKMAGELVASLLNLLITIPLNFIVNKYWAYKRSKERSA